MHPVSNHYAIGLTGLVTLVLYGYMLSDGTRAADFRRIDQKIAMARLARAGQAGEANAASAVGGGSTGANLFDGFVPSGSAPF
jgi:hypothetical protein